MANSVYYIPNGPKNLAPLFAPSFDDIEEYFVQVKDGSGAVISTGNICQVTPPSDNFIRIHFLNRLGAIDSMSFILTDVVQEPKSDALENPVQYPLVRSRHAAGRFNVRSNDTYTASNVDMLEEDMPFVDELFASPLAWIQWPGAQGEADDYLPIVISDKKNEKRKFDDRFTYDVEIEFKLSHEKFNIRN